MAVWSEVRVAHIPENLRIDPEYYQPVYLNYERRCSAGDLLGSLTQRIIHPVEIVREYAEEGIRILLAQNIRQNFLDLSHEAFMPPACRSVLARNRLLPGDVVMTRSGANFGDAACYFGEPEEIYACADCLILRPLSIASGFLATFFNTTIGRGLLTRGAYGAAQPHIAPPYLRSLRIPRLGKYEQKVHDLVLLAESRRKDSVALYQEAEIILYASLGLAGLDLSPSLFYERPYHDVTEGRRVDAEHFNPRHYKLLEKIKATGHAVRLGDCLQEPVKRGVQPDYQEDGPFRVINSQHVGKVSTELDDNRRVSNAFAKEKRSRRAVVRPMDVLLNSTGFITIGRCQPMMEQVDAIVDQHISILRPKEGLDPLFLALFLNSLPGQMQTERGWTGSSGQIELRPDVIEDYQIWKAPPKIQSKIRSLIEQSHEARSCSSRLLNEAKCAVEAAITKRSSSAN